MERSTMTLRRRLPRALLLLLSWFLLFHDVVVAAQPSNDFIVAAYLPDYRFYINVNNTAPFLTDLILFSLQPTLDGCCLGEDHYRIVREAQAYKRQHHGEKSELRLWVAVGGGGRSDGFAEIAADKEKRTKFLQSLIDLCKKEGLQGVDFDWEIPRTHEDLQAYVDLLLQACKTMHKANLLVSVALHARQFMPPQLYHTVDRVHFMAYDLAAEHVAQYDLVVTAAKEFVQYKCPPSKLVLGIPAYARHSSNPGMVKSFAELMDDSSDVAATRPEWSGYRYDSPAFIQKKVEYAIANELAGVFFWELGQDKQHAELGPGGILLEAAAAAATSPTHTAQHHTEL